MMSFGEQLQRFRERTANHRGRFKALILPGTRQDITAALLIGALEPERVAFLLTAQTRGMPQDVAQKLNSSCDRWFIPDGDYSNTNTIYIGIKKVLEEWPDLNSVEIAADVTGGFVPMSVGIAKAAHVLKLSTTYVLSDYEGRTPIPGTQRLELLPDPYTVFGDLEADEARRLYAMNDYAGAQRIFANLEERLKQHNSNGDQKDKDMQRRSCYYYACATLSQTYAAWDVFDWDQARVALETLLQSPLLPDLEPERARLQVQLAMLQRLASENNLLEKENKGLLLPLLTNLESVLPLLGTLHANARRRVEQGRYDVAAMFHYRCLELLSQHRLAMYGISSERPDFTAALRERSSLKQDYKRVQREQGRKKASDLPERTIGLFVGYMLLAALDDPLVRGYPIKDIEDRTYARNKSMLAHGFRLITRNEYNQFREVVDAMLARFFQECEHDQATWEQHCQFLDPFEQQV
jgi:CRISPR-associated protein (TIGR02710 family)